MGLSNIKRITLVASLRRWPLSTVAGGRIHSVLTGRFHRHTHPSTFWDILFSKTTLNVIGLLATIIPFYHGATRYLEATYVTAERKVKSAALLLDFTVLLMEGICFYFLALFIQDFVMFYWILIATLVIDIFWILTTFFTVESKSATSLTINLFKCWGVPNLCYVVIGILILSIRVIDNKEFLLFSF